MPIKQPTPQPPFEWGGSIALASMVLLLLLGASCTKDRFSPDNSGADSCDEKTCSGTDAKKDNDTSEPPPLEFGCVQNWPTPEPAVPVASLDVPRLTLQGGDKVGYHGGGEEIALWGGRIGLIGLNIFYSYDVATRTHASYDRAASTCQVISSPAIRLNEPGGFAFGCIGVLGLRANFWESAFLDHAAWVLPLGTNKSQEFDTTQVSPMVVHPNGTLYFSASDETTRAVRPHNGEEIWRHSNPFVQNNQQQPYFGVGDRVFGSKGGFHPETGMKFAPARAGADELVTFLPTYSRRIVGFSGRDDVNLRTAVIDECGSIV
ncbi:MAG: hypothetical protein FWD57_14840 [Polyangiaceae bacterium]|nr:hypothetical protein [Polyangiaceae bacterium]